MEQPLFNIVFKGKTKQGADPAEVRVQLAKLLRIKENEIEHFFSGEPVVIKRDLENQQALKYKQAIEKTGALCSVVPKQSPARQASSEEPVQQDSQQSDLPALKEKHEIRPVSDTEGVMRYKEYKVVHVAESGCGTILLGAASLPIQKLEAALNEAAADGWQLVFQVIEKRRFMLFWTRETVIITLGR